MRTWIAFLLCVSVEIAAVPQKEVIVTMQTKRWTHILSDNFLSLTVTPEIALQLEDFSKTTMNMLKGLSPTMLRLGGPSTDKMKFMPEKISSDNFTITEAQWTRLNQFIEDVNMNLVVCLNSKDRVHGVWESRDSVELIYSSEKNGYKLGWELGYESQNLQQDGVTGSQLGRDVARLKNILGDFSKYSDSPIIGPDMKSLSTPEEVRFLREYLEESADSLTAITWHPQFSSMNAEDEDVSHKFLGIIHDMENKIWNKSNGLRSPIQPPPKKPIWLAESNSDEYTGNFSDSLTWIKRMGAAARLGFPVIMKKLTAASLITPTPDYWVSLLYKTLVGRAVMDVKYLVGNNRSTLQVFSHCAHVNEEGSDSVLAPGLRYTQGSVVLYGLNLNDEETRLTVRGNVKEETVHKYVLTAAEDDHEMEASDEEETEIRKRPSPAKTLLNGQLLSLLSNSELPTISPVETRPSRTLSFNIPGRSVFFFVMPDMRLKTCTSFTNIQGNEKVNTLERGQSLMKSSFMAATRPEDGPKFNFSPGGKINLESRLPVDANSNELWKPPSFGVGLKGRFSDGRLNRGLVGLPRPRIPLDSNRLKTIEKGTVLQDQLSTTIQTPVEETEQINEFENKTIGDEMQPIDDQEPLKTKTRFVMFSDDDWLSNFTRAQESVELARKAIAAFDEAKLQETFKSPQNSFEEQIMNQRMSPTRRRIYEAFTAASSEKKNLTRGEKDRGARNAEIDLGGSREEKVYNRERRDSMVHESSRNIEESPVIRNMYQQSEQRDNWEIQNKTGNPASNYIKIVRSNDISQNSPEQRNQTGEEGIQQIPIQTSSFKNQDGNLNKRNITSQHDENINSSMIPGNPAGLENIEIDEMVLKGDSQEENKCFGQFISDLKVISEDNARNGENDKILKQKAERELNNYFEEISNRDVSLSGIDASDESGESVEADDEKDLQQHSISLYNVNDKSCKVALNKSMNGSQDAIEEKSLNSELPSFDSKGNLNQNQSAQENNKLQSNDLPDEVILSENDKRVERGRREMFGSPFNYYDSRYNIPNQLTLREIKKLIDDLAARKRELNYVMLNRKETPENNLKINSFEESATDHTEIYGNDSSTGPMHITIEDSVEGTESPVDDYKLESTNDFSNIQYNIDEDENRFEQKNRLHRQPQYNNKKPGKTDTDNIFVPEELQGDFHNQDSEVEASPISKPVLEISPEDMTNKGNKNVENIEPGKIGTNIRLSLAKEEEYNIGKSKNQFLEKTPESLDGDIQLTDVNNAPKIPITYSKVVTIIANDEKNEKLEKEKELGSVKTSTDKSVGSISIPKMNATQLRLERIESLRNRLLESRKKVIKSNLINATTKPPQILKKTPIEKSNANTAPDLDEKVPSGYLEEGAPTCKASRSAPYVEGIENWIDKIERDSEEIVAGFPHNQKVIGKQNVSSTVDKFNAEKESSQEDKSRKIDLIKSSRPITGTNKSINRMNGVQSGSIALKNRGTDVLTFDEMNSPFIIIPTSYAIMPIKPKRSRAAKNIRGYRSYNIGNVDRRDHLDDFPIIRQEGGNHDIRSYNMGLEDNEFEAESDDIIPYSFPLMVTDPELTESLMENYGREKRSPEETADSNVGMLNRGLLNVKGLKRGFNGFRRNLLKTDNSKLQSLVSKISLEEIRSRVLARSKALRETLENARLKTPIKSRETRAISNIESRSRARSALGFADDLETNEIPKKRGEYLNVYEPVYDTSAEFEKKINSYKTYSRAIPISSRKSSIIHLDGDEVNAIKKQGSAKAYTDDNDYLNERMSRTDRAVVGLKHSVEELENTAKEILDKVRSSSDYSNVEERKKPFLQNILQSTLKLGRPKEPKRTGALAFLNPIIDIALKLMRSLGIIS